MGRLMDDEFEWFVEGRYGGRWEVVTGAEDRAEAERLFAEYDANEPQYPHRITKVRKR